MSGIAQDTTRSAVFLIERGAVTRRLLYSEFESLLDHIVAVKELAGRRIKAVFVDIDGALNVVAAVFFWVEFDGQGQVHIAPGLQLPSVLDGAGRGPDLGGGPIALVSRDHRPPALTVDQLWEPEQCDGRDDYAVIRQVVSDNGLSLSVVAPAVSSATVLAGHAAGDDGIPLLSATADGSALAGHPGSDDLAAALAEARRDNQALRESLEEQGAEFRQLRELIGSQVAKIEEGEELGRRLVEKEAECERLQGRLARLESDNAQLSERADGRELLQQMQEAGISHLASQPGAGEFHLPAKDIRTYLASPVEYAARFCCVDLGHYQAWLGHHERPVCRHLKSDGLYCDLPVHRVDSPTAFVVGESDCCSQHRSSSLALSRLFHAS